MLFALFAFVTVLVLLLALRSRVLLWRICACDMLAGMLMGLLLFSLFVVVLLVILFILFVMST